MKQTRIILYTGKGGVGKTSIAAATALRASQNGLKTIVLSTDSAHSLGDSFDIKIITPDSSNDVDGSFKDKASFTWTSNNSGQTMITIQNTGDSEFTENYKFELERDPLFFTYSILVIIAGIVIIGFSAGFSAKKPKGF